MKGEHNVLETHGLERPFSIKCAYAFLALQLSAVSLLILLRLKCFCTLVPER
jgi:hypothetical protein